MNRLLIAILDVINKLLALFIIVSATVEGYRGDFAGYVYVPPANITEQVLWGIFGFLIGLALAGIFSGFIAAVITIARELMGIREVLTMRAWSNPPPG
jgi:hypothetical protein